MRGFLPVAIVVGLREFLVFLPITGDAWPEPPTAASTAFTRVDWHRLFTEHEFVWTGRKPKLPQDSSRQPAPGKTLQERIVWKR